VTDTDVPPPARRERWAGFGFLLIAIVWGGTFPVVKDLVERVPPHALVAARFCLAWLVLSGWAWHQRQAWGPGLLRAGVLAGLILWGGFFTQTLGLQYTSASKAGFITALNVVFVAVMAALFLGKRSGPRTWAGVAVATVGLAVLSLDFSEGLQGLRPQIGDLLVLLCAVLFAAHIVVVDQLAPRFDPVLLAWVQMGTAGAVAGASAWAVDGGLPGVLAPANAVPLLYLGLLATAGALLAQVSLQRFVRRRGSGSSCRWSPCLPPCLRGCCSGRGWHPAAGPGARWCWPVWFWRSWTRRSKRPQGRWRGSLHGRRDATAAAAQSRSGSAVSAAF